MMLSSTQLQPPTRERYTPTRYVYVKMLTRQADTQEGKLVKGQVLVVPEDKASRWVYRARIARPATKAEYDKYQQRMSAAARSGQGVRRRPVRGMSIPDENPFEYVVPEDQDWGEAEAHADQPHDSEELSDDEQEVRLTGGNTLSDRLGAMNRSAETDEDETPESEKSDEELEEEVDEEVDAAFSGYHYPGDEVSERDPEPGHYTDVVTRPGGDPEALKPLSDNDKPDRPRARARGSR